MPGEQSDECLYHQGDQPGQGEIQDHPAGYVHPGGFINELEHVFPFLLSKKDLTPGAHQAIQIHYNNKWMRGMNQKNQACFPHLQIPKDYLVDWIHLFLKESVAFVNAGTHAVSQGEGVHITLTGE